MERKLEVGGVIVFIDSVRQQHNALIVQVHGPAEGTKYTRDGVETIDWPCLNVVYVDSDERKKDCYGRQTCKEPTSVMYMTENSAGGNCWCWPDEAPQ